ncbi:hypothetical protein QFC20_005895 [Naganishia adeliensis]|uniref:Uncharacterized protein n=1 Tax=Naganishia adeliensis TaxID=92952 RepID=A0ACC2VIB1_9TREE|nr:hypothetical protein QFC20_005895 [Naganishia adeliensis]
MSEEMLRESPNDSGSQETQKPTIEGSGSLPPGPDEPSSRKPASGAASVTTLEIDSVRSHPAESPSVQSQLPSSVRKPIPTSPRSESPAALPREGDTTVVENETCTYDRKPSPPRTLTKTACPTTVASAEEPSPDYHVLTDVTWDDEDDLETEYNREKIWWDAWKQDGLAQIAARMKVLQKEKTHWECRHFPDFDQWYRNRQLVEAANKGQQTYSNQEPFRFVDAQLIGKQLISSVSAAEKTAKSHAANKVKWTSPSKRTKHV